MQDDRLRELLGDAADAILTPSTANKPITARPYHLSHPDSTTQAGTDRQPSEAAAAAALIDADPAKGQVRVEQAADEPPARFSAAAATHSPHTDTSAGIVPGAAAARTPSHAAGTRKRADDNIMAEQCEERNGTPPPAAAPPQLAPNTPCTGKQALLLHALAKGAIDKAIAANNALNTSEADDGNTGDAAIGKPSEPAAGTGDADAQSKAAATASDTPAATSQAQLDTPAKNKLKSIPVQRLAPPAPCLATNKRAPTKQQLSSAEQDGSAEENNSSGTSGSKAKPSSGGSDAGDESADEGHEAAADACTNVGGNVAARGSHDTGELTAQMHAAKTGSGAQIASVRPQARSACNVDEAHAAVADACASQAPGGQRAFSSAEQKNLTPVPAAKPLSVTGMFRASASAAHKDFDADIPADASLARTLALRSGGTADKQSFHLGQQSASNNAEASTDAAAGATGGNTGPDSGESATPAAPAPVPAAQQLGTVCGGVLKTEYECIDVTDL